jgi:hypothetical protein
MQLNHAKEITSTYPLLDHGDGLAWVESLGAGLGAVHDGVAAVQLEGVV